MIWRRIKFGTMPSSFTSSMLGFFPELPIFSVWQSFEKPSFLNDDIQIIFLNDGFKPMTEIIFLLCGKNTHQEHNKFIGKKPKPYILKHMTWKYNLCPSLLSSFNMLSFKYSMIGSILVGSSCSLQWLHLQPTWGLNYPIFSSLVLSYKLRLLEKSLDKTSACSSLGI